MNNSTIYGRCECPYCHLVGNTSIDFIKKHFENCIMKPKERKHKMKHPIQPLVEDGQGVVRFKENKIVSYLLDNTYTKEGKSINLNDIARMNFDREDREQFAQLIGYSYSGACDLGYMSTEVLETANKIYEEGKDNKDQKDVMIEYLQHQLHSLRNSLADTLCVLFEVHPDDLKRQ